MNLPLIFDIMADADTTTAIERKFSDTAYDGRVEDLEVMLKVHPGLNVNCTDEDQWTPLHWASLKGHIEVVKLLLAHPDIAVNVTDR